MTVSAITWYLLVFLFGWKAEKYISAFATQKKAYFLLERLNANFHDYFLLTLSPYFEVEFALRQVVGAGEHKLGAETRQTSIANCESVSPLQWYSMELSVSLCIFPKLIQGILNQ